MRYWAGYTTLVTFVAVLCAIVFRLVRLTTNGAYDLTRILTFGDYVNYAVPVAAYLLPGLLALFFSAMMMVRSAKKEFTDNEGRWRKGLVWRRAALMLVIYLIGISIMLLHEDIKGWFGFAFLLGGFFLLIWLTLYLQLKMSNGDGRNGGVFATLVVGVVLVSACLGFKEGNNDTFKDYDRVFVEGHEYRNVDIAMVDRGVAILERGKVSLIPWDRAKFVELNSAPKTKKPKTELAYVTLQNWAVQRSSDVATWLGRCVAGVRHWWEQPKPAKK